MVPQDYTAGWSSGRHSGSSGPALRRQRSLSRPHAACAGPLAVDYTAGWISLRPAAAALTAALAAGCGGGGDRHAPGFTPQQQGCGRAACRLPGRQKPPARQPDMRPPASFSCPPTPLRVAGRQTAPRRCAPLPPVHPSLPQKNPRRMPTGAAAGSGSGAVAPTPPPAAAPAPSSASATVPRNEAPSAKRTKRSRLETGAKPAPLGRQAPSVERKRKQDPAQKKGSHATLPGMPRSPERPAKGKSPQPRAKRKAQKNWRRKHREHIRKYNQRYWAKNKEEQNARRRVRRRPEPEAFTAGLSIVTARQLRRPPLLWIDTTGQTHREDYRSAEELLRRWRQKNPKSSTG